MTRDTFLFLSAFLASGVEMVEALTIVLAVGVTRGWRSTLIGAGAAALVLAIVVAILGPAVSALPFDVLRIVVGGLLLVFGLQWLRKAILRASGFKALHDEDAIYRRQLAEASTRTPAEASTAGPATGRLKVDGYGFTLAFKGVLLEGLEVVVIVLTFGAGQHQLGLAAVAAACAVLLVAAAGAAIRAPLARVPENTLKFVVGIMLTAFGLFWGAEGAGAHWPGSDAALLVLVPVVALWALTLTALLRRRHATGLAA
ncbi:MAG TPA: hypothetical protein VGI21_26765 [Streptosporangiaceae bacterium]